MWRFSATKTSASALPKQSKQRFCRETRHALQGAIPEVAGSTVVSVDVQVHIQLLAIVGEVHCLSQATSNRLIPAQSTCSALIFVGRRKG